MVSQENHLQIAALLDYIPYFSSENKKYKVSETFSFDPYIYEDTASDFVAKLHETGMIIPFDWSAWQEKASRYFENAALIHHADLLTIQKLFTTMIRADRVHAGTYASMIDRGVILQLLKRLEILLEQQKSARHTRSSLTNAIILAAQKHDGQTDKGGQPYILHPLRVMQAADTEEERVVAVLHDIIEDTDCTLEHLHSEGFSPAVMEAIDCLTRQSKESYGDFIQRIKANPLAAKIKRLDIQDNMNIDRIPNPSQQDYDRLEKYKDALVILNEGMAK